VDHKPRVLFFSTSDSTRSQMAEGFLRKLAGEELAVVSTAVQSPDSDPLAAEVMKEIGVDISGQQSRGVKESLKEHFSYVITVSDNSRERSPVWPFTRNLFHWNIADPERLNGSLEQKREAFGVLEMRSVGRSENSWLNCTRMSGRSAHRVTG
jgi:arsenate reductase (thioredoxin)